MGWFFFRYVLWAIGLVGVFFLPNLSPLFAVQAWQTQFTIELTRGWIELFALPVTLEGYTVYLSHPFQIWIVDSCNGLTAYLLLAAAILAYPTHSRVKTLWLMETYLILAFLNSLRITLVIYATQWDSDYFYCAHDCIGRYSFIVMTLLLFVFFSQRVKSNQNNSPPINAHKAH